MNVRRVLGVAGSLRRGSLNRALLRTAQEMAPEAGLAVESFDLASIPLYDGDRDGPTSPPEVVAWREAIRAADGLLLVTPEYNYGLPGVLKNAVDWASRPPTGSVLLAKPCAIVGASSGMFGSLRAQLQLRQTLFATRSPTMQRPEVYVARAGEKFDAQGRLVDDATRRILAGFLAAFGAWIAREARPAAVPGGL